jgi:hypothetical protein
MAGDAIVGRIVAILSVEDKQFTAGITKAKGQFSGIGDAARKFGGILAASFSAAAVVDFVKECVTEFAAEQAALVALGTAVNAAGSNWGDYITATQEAMVAGEQLGFKGHETAKALQVLTVMTGDAAKGYRLLALAQDMTRGRPGTDLAANASILAKVAEGRIAMASRVLPFLKGVTDVDQAMTLMEQHFAGQSDAYAKTTQGSIDRMSASWEGFMEMLGSKVAPTVSKNLDDMSAAMNNFSSGGGITGGAFTLLLGDETSTYIDAADAVGDYGNELRVLWDGTMTMTPQIAAKMAELRASAEGASTYVADATASISRFSNSAQNAASATQDMADKFALLKAELSDSRTTAEGYTDAVLAEQAATKKLDDDRKNGAGRAQIMQDEQKLGDAHKQTAVSLGQLAEEYQNLTPAQIRAAVKSHELTKEQGALFISAHKSGKEVGVLKGKLAELPSHKKVTVYVDDSQVEAWLKHWASISKSLNLHVYGSGVVVKPPKHKALGGVMTRPEIVQVGEAGTEVIVPTKGDANSRALLATAASLNGVSGGGGSSSVVINVYADSMSDRRAIRAEVEGALSTITRGSRSLAFGG